MPFDVESDESGPPSVPFDFTNLERKLGAIVAGESGEYELVEYKQTEYLAWIHGCGCWTSCWAFRCATCNCDLHY